MDKVTSAHAFEVIERLRSYTEFESATIAADGAVTVKYAARVANKDPRDKEKAPKKTAIDSLVETAPNFSFGK